MKKSILKKGYFTIVFTQIFLESFMILILLCISILSIIGFKGNKDIYFTILILIYIFCYISDIFYNIISLIILTFKNKKSDKEDLEYDLYDTEEKTGTEKIKIDESSYAIHHIFSFLLSGIQTALFYFFYLRKNNPVDVHAWYYYFFETEKNLKYLFFFSINAIYFISALAYCFKKDNINSFKLKNYSIYCFVSSLLNFIYPAKIILNKFEIKEIIIKYTYFPLTLVYLVYTCFYRLNCYYIQFVLENGKNRFCGKICFGLKIIFTCCKIPDLNFADFNSNFIFHALTGKIDIKDINNDDIVHRSLSNSLSFLENENL
jgi:hypothetical protein